MTLLFVLLFSALTFRSAIYLYFVLFKVLFVSQHKPLSLLLLSFRFLTRFTNSFTVLTNSANVFDYFTNSLKFCLFREKGSFKSSALLECRNTILIFSRLCIFNPSLLLKIPITWNFYFPPWWVWQNASIYQQIRKIILIPEKEITKIRRNIITKSVA